MLDRAVAREARSTRRSLASKLNAAFASHHSSDAKPTPGSRPTAPHVQATRHGPADNHGGDPDPNAATIPSCLPSKRSSSGDGSATVDGSGAVWSGRWAAILFALFQTLVLWEINPRVWLTADLTACPEAGGQAPLRPEALLPWNLSEKQRRTWSLGPPSDESEQSDHPEHGETPSGELRMLVPRISCRARCADRSS
jgi:hypothetical protein